MTEENEKTDVTILQAIKQLRGSSKKRNFSQTFDLIVNLKNINVKKPEGKINEIVELPAGRGKKPNLVVFSDTMKVPDCRIMGAADIESAGKDKKAMKRFAKSVDFLLSEPRLMPLVGKVLGMTLAPRGKMPAVLVGDAAAMISKLKNSTRVKVKDSPVIQCMVGSESMKDEDIAENIETVMKFLAKRLPKGRNNIRNVRVKLTMSKPVKIEA